MDRMTEQIAEIFKQLEDELAVAEREFREIDERYDEVTAARKKAYRKWQNAQRAFECIDTLQGLIEKEETSDE